MKTIRKPVETVAEAAKAEPPKAKVEASGATIHQAASLENIGAVKQHLAGGADVNAKGESGRTPLDLATQSKRNLETADLLRKHGGKTKKELEAAGNLSQSTPPFEC